MSHRDQRDLIPFKIEEINDPIVSNAKLVFTTALETLMRIRGQTPTDIANLSKEPTFDRFWEFGKNAIELLGINLCGLRHAQEGVTVRERPSSRSFKPLSILAINSGLRAA
jgi:hypothetical protein